MKSFYLNAIRIHPELGESYELEAHLKKEFAPAIVLALPSEKGDIYEIRFDEDQELILLKLQYGYEMIPKSVASWRILNKLYDFRAALGGVYYPEDE